MAESFFSRVNAEPIDGRIWQSREERSRAVFDALEDFCNRARLHSSLGDRTSAEVEHDDLVARNTGHAPLSTTLREAQQAL